MKKVFSFLTLILNFDYVSCVDVTEQQILPNPYCYLKNLYFDSNSRTFTFVGKKANINATIDLKDSRGFRTKIVDDINQKNNLTYLGGGNVILLDMCDGFVTHFFHLLEHLLGVWSFYAHSQHLNVKNILIFGDGKRYIPQSKINGPNNINLHILKALFPVAQIYTIDTFCSKYKNKIICFEEAITSDRNLTSLSSKCAKINKHLGEAKEFISKESLDKLATLVATYNKVKINKNSHVNVTYIQRHPPRKLSDFVEQKLLSEIRKIKNVNLIAVAMEKINFDQQINIIRNTDVLIGVHGNGLSHILFLKPSAKVIEIFPNNTNALDYRLFADIRGIEYYGMMENKIIEQNFAYERGPFGNVNVGINFLNFDLIKNIIENEVKKKKN